jgi:hypothetical protein
MRKYMIIMNGDLGGMWEECIMTLFEVLSWHLPEGV